MGAEAFRAAGKLFEHRTILIRLALLMAIQKMAAYVFETTPGAALKVIIAVVASHFLTVEASAWVDAAAGTAAEGGFDAVVVAVAKNLS